jgi:group I intron endonuclease
MQPCIYKIVNKITNIFYIGSAMNYEARWQKHVNDLRANRHDNNYLQNAWNKYGESAFEIQILEFCEKETLLMREQWWIETSNCCNRAMGYNLSPKAGSVKGIKWSDASKALMSKLKSGGKHSAETKQKMSETRKKNGHLHGAKLRGRKHTEDHKRKIGEQSRDTSKWPCREGSKCRCQMCMTTRMLAQRDYRERLKNAD